MSLIWISGLEPRRVRCGSKPTMDKAHNTPSDVTAEDGEVIFEGPRGVAFSLTPDAALETSDRLLNGGLTAQGQLVDKRRKEGTPEPPPR